MKKWTKSIALILVLALALMLVAACGSGSKGAVDKIKKAGKLTMLTNAAFAPYEYVDEANGVNGVAGVDVEIAKAIADELGVSLEVVNMDFDGIVASVQTGKGDLGIAGITNRPDRAEVVDFSINYVDTAQLILTDEATAKELAGKSADDLVAWLDGKNVGVQSGTTGHNFVDEETGGKATPYKTAPDAAIELANGKLDAVVIDEMPAKQLAATNEGLAVVEEPLTTEQYAIAIAKENTDLKDVVNKVLEKLIKDGKVDAWIEQHKAASEGK